ncbi:MULTISPECIES: hypothetical protein [Anaerolinea]|uniref:hypothetical protein n=1 Tax=Anaerolinea TaxID=233189 RepID=UPI002635FE71|nr:hypothetical protein [Anaerolinea thermophila]
MHLSAEQMDTLTEMVNIGFGRAAASLSALVRQRIVLIAPEIALYPLEELPHQLNFLSPEVTSVHQIFSGAINGDAILLLDYESASILVNLLTGEPPVPRPLTSSDREALTEIGNILLNAFIGTLGNLLKVKIFFAVPRLNIEAVHDMLQTLHIGGSEIRYTLVVKTYFETSDGSVSGYVVMVMGLESLERLSAALDPSPESPK